MEVKRHQVRGLIHQLISNPGQALDRDYSNVARLQKMFPNLRMDEIQGFMHMTRASIGQKGENLALTSSLYLLYDVLRDDAFVDTDTSTS